MRDLYSHILIVVAAIVFVLLLIIDIGSNCVGIHSAEQADLNSQRSL